MVQTHLTIFRCKDVPASEVTQLSVAKSSGKMLFDEFLLEFLGENGIVESSDGRGVVVFSDEDFTKIPG